MPVGSTLPPQRELSVYLHLPFCTVKCDYCDFYSLAGAGSALVDRTLAAVAEDAQRMIGGALAPEGTIATVYIGGGTPSILALGELETLLEKLGGSLPNRPAEWTFEANPETLTVEKLHLLREHGVDRISLGVQSLDASGLATLGRAATEGATRRALALLSKAWPLRWSADLILGYEGDTPRRVERDLTEMIAAGARHVSVYALTVEEGTPLAEAVARGERKVPGEEEVLALLEVARELLEARGLRRYEVSNYAVAGEEGRHNQRYWRMEPYLGLGPAAAGTLYYPPPAADPAPGELRGPWRPDRALSPLALRLTGRTPIGLYLVSRSRRYLEEHLDASQLLAEHLLMGLRTAEGVDLASLDRRLALPVAMSREAVSPLVEEGVLELSPGGSAGCLRIPQRRWDLLDHHIMRVEERLSALLEELSPG